MADRAQSKNEKRKQRLFRLDEQQNKLSKQKKRRNRWFTKNIFQFASIGVLLISFVLAFAGWSFVKQFEDGVLEVCAEQQDAYVQLVLDQINLRDNRDDEAIVKDILGSLDASSNKYWTFSKNEAMLFVKDVVETNKYKGFTTATYYVSDSAQQFLGDLQLNRVKHRTIQIQENEYIASGVVFEYGGAEYRLCLLTNRDVFLDNNYFLQNEINVGIFFFLAIVLLIVSTMALSRWLGLQFRTIQEKEEMIAELNKSVITLNERLRVKMTYDTRRTLFNEDMMYEFLGRLETKGVRPITCVIVNSEQPEHFLDKAQILLDRSVLRFRLEDVVPEDEPDAIVGSLIMLLFIKQDQKQSVSSLRNLLDKKTKIHAIGLWNGSEIEFEDYAQGRE